ncbi:hypothetical protein [Nocardia sp. CA-119907]|uniref:hypothetical protein n=1 Tax=Nocardia sp. CA-119907 TaxID=3239973 RepID=UPI003D95731C
MDRAPYRTFVRAEGIAGHQPTHRFVVATPAALIDHTRRRISELHTIMRAAVRDARSDTDDLNDILSSIDPAQRADLLATYRRNRIQDIRTLATGLFRIHVVMAAYSMTMPVLLAGVAFGVLLVSRSVHQAAASYLGFNIGLAFPVVSRAAIRRVHGVSFIIELAVVLGWSTVCLTYAIRVGIQLERHDAMSLLNTAVLSAGVSNLMVLAAFGSMFYLTLGMRRRLDSHNPIDTLCRRLLAACRIIRTPARFRLVAERETAISLIVISAGSIRDLLPGRSVLPDTASRAVVQQRQASAAAFVRSLAVWVGLPRADTPAFLTAELHTLIRTVFLAQFDNLPRHEEAIQIPFRDRAGYLLRELVIALTPLSATVVVGATELDVPAALLGGLVPFSILWAVVGLARVLDPRLGDKIALSKDLLAVLPSLRGGPVQ